jgi:oligopeptide/dipeptide ABC transporter ATP-binding protein
MAGQPGVGTVHGADGPTGTDPRDQVLRVRDLTVHFQQDARVIQAVRGVSFDIAAGEIVGLVGESGSGKSVTCNAILGLLPRNTATVSGQVRYGGADLLQLKYSALQRIRGAEIAMIFQDPMTAFNPVQTLGRQIVEAIQLHRRTRRAAARREAADLLALVGVPDPARRLDQYPHEFSGGMRQRAMIAMAIANRPKVLIADEPTTALDVTIQAQVLQVLRDVQQETGTAVVLVTHDLGIVAQTADRVMVMYAGRVVEQAPVLPLFEGPRHPYTDGLIGSLPRINERLDELASIPGRPPAMSPPPPGCVYADRCALRRGRDECVDDEPQLLQVGPERLAACHFSAELAGVRAEEEQR